MPTTEQIQLPHVPQRAEWFVHNRFGLFIHWGIYAVAARHEWVKRNERLTDEHYQRYFEHFDPDLYDPQAWARAAKQAGMKYAVITTKHHDGFCLFDSQLTDYKAPNTPAQRDLIAPWVEAFRAEGLKVGFYYSLLDWHHPEFVVDGLHPQAEDLTYRERNQHRDQNKYIEYLHGQVRELLTNYGKIDVLWADFSYAERDWGWSKGKGKEDWQSEKLVKMVRELQPDILINPRLDLAGDFYTPEEAIPQEWLRIDGQRVTWEACQTLNGSWGYYRDKEQWKSPDALVRMLIDCVSKGGNLLLNVGPTARGEFEPRAQQTLAAIGDWMHQHGRAIYGATECQYTPPADCRYTQRGNRLYLHLFAWPIAHLSLPSLNGRVEYAQFLHDGSEVPFREDTEHLLIPGKEQLLTLQLPLNRPNVEVPVIEIFLKERE